VISHGPDRREFLCALAALGGASAGCLSLGGNDTPRYTDLVPAVDDGATFGYLDFNLTEETDSETQVVPILLPSPSSGGSERPVEVVQGELSERDDPLLSFSLEVGGWILAAGTFGFSAAGLSTYVEREQSEAVDELLVANDTVLGTGEFDTDKLDERLRTQSDRPSIPTYEFVDETGGFRFYRLSVSAEFDPPSVVAVDETRIVLGNSRDDVERLAETATGERDRAVAAVERFDSLAEQVGEGSLVVGWYGSADLSDAVDATDPLPDALSQSDVATAADLVPEDDELTVDLAVRADSLSATQRDRLETTFGTQQSETTASPDVGQFSVSRTYDEIPFQPLGSDPTDDLPSGEDLPPEIEQAVPDGAVEFSEAPEQGVYRVELVEEIQVDELTIRTIEAERETTFDSPDSLKWISVFPDESGDEIRVIATVDGVSGIVATKEIP
jgi:hypothetical protein